MSDRGAWRGHNPRFIHLEGFDTKPTAPHNTNVHNYYISISNGLLKDGHRKRMGAAVWEYMWCLDKVTRIDEKGRGYVLGGKPIKLAEIATQLEVAEDTVSRNLSALEEAGYIEKVIAPYGIIIKVKKAKKRFNKSVEPKRNDESAEAPRKSVEPNKTIAVDSTAKDIAAPSAAPAKPFNAEETKRKWYDGEDAVFQLLAWFFDKKNLWRRFDSQAKVTAAVSRHIRVARRIAKGEWTQPECEKALRRLLENGKMRDEWQLETLEKYLTK